MFIQIASYLVLIRIHNKARVLLIKTLGAMKLNNDFGRAFFTTFDILKVLQEK